MEILKKLQTIQQELKAPKNQRNNFGNYNYRSCEDILEAVKPLLKKEKMVLIIKDELINIGDRYYVKSTAELMADSETIKSEAYARESETKKGMDEAQITGASSSYARKYALNGLFLIDDTKDYDTMDNSKAEIENLKKQVDKIKSVDELREFYKKNTGKGKEFEEHIMLKSKELKDANS